MKIGKMTTALGIGLCFSLLISEDYTPEQQQALGQKALREVVQIIYSETMAAAKAFQENQLREDVISNFSTTAPRIEFSVNADISEELQDGTQSAIVYVSTDGQATWQSAAATLIGTEGYENTWGGTINTNEGTTAYSYLSGVVDSEALGESYGTIIVSGSPHNVSGDWPPLDNLYALMATDPSGDASSSSQDILGLYGTYKGTDAVDNEGNEYTDVERIYFKLPLNSGCCDEGGLFGPWYIYGVGLVNPEFDPADPIAYALVYGDGGFGQLTPGLLKIYGDLSTGEVGGFDYITTNISYNTRGNNLQVTALMSYIANDSQFGEWPNAYNGFIVLGATIEASLDGLDVAAEIKDMTDAPGLMVCTTTHQDGNIALSLSNPVFDSETNTASVTYSDGDGNLPWFKSVQICDSGTDNCFFQMDMIPDEHTYEDGVRFSASFTSGDVASGDYDAHFWFADDDIDNYPNAQISIPITVGGGGGGCALEGDLNSDGNTNVLDVVLLVNLVLNSYDLDDCSDVNGDGQLNVLDVVLLVNIVLG